MTKQTQNILSILKQMSGLKTGILTGLNNEKKMMVFYATLPGRRVHM